MSTVICRPAALVRQGNLKLYATSLRVRDLMIENFYDIERLDPEDPTDKGYQRVLNKARAKRLADYLVDGQENADAFLPTSIFLATFKDVNFDSATNTITFDVSEVGPFSVVDGQHRVEGLKLAAEKKPEILDFEIPVNIAVNLPHIAQMCHFLIVNTTQKSVDAAVEQRIYARLTDAVTIDDVPSLPRWMQRIVESGDDKQALNIVDYLNSTPGSPWQNKIKLSNQDNSPFTVNQGTFVKMIKRYVLTANNPVSVRPIEQQQKIFFNYWKAISLLLDTGQPSVLYKYIGVELFSRFSTPFFNKLQHRNDFTISTMETLLRGVFENLEGDYAGVGHPDWWLSGIGIAGGLNSTAIGKFHNELVKAMHNVQDSANLAL